MATQPREKQLRVQGPRSSLGCQTCKSRHVKCDMRKPQCQRCVRIGKACDYLKGIVTQPVCQIIIYSVPGSPLAFPDLDGPAQRALHHYRTRVASAIALPFGSELWSTIAIQMSAHYDFVMSALVALSSMYELFFQSTASQTSLQFDGIRHYNKAIREIVGLGQNENPVDAILVSCVVFYAIESLRGSWTRALQHGLSGMQIIKERRRETSNASGIPVEVLDETFLALQIQVMELGGQDEARVFRPTDNPEPYVPVAFSSINEALHHVNVIYNESACLLDYYRVQHATEDKTAGDTQMVLEQRLAFLHARMSDWTTAMQNLWSLGDKDTSCHQFHAVLILNMYHAAFQYAFDSIVQGSSCDYSNVLDHAEAFLKCQAQEEDLRSRTYSISLGVIPVLFMLATKGDLRLQERSLNLLRAHHRREGPWDSEVTVRLAEKVITTKEELIKRNGEQTSVAVLEMSFIDDTKCQITYVVSVKELAAQGSAWPAIPLDNSSTYVDIIGIHGA